MRYLVLTPGIGGKDGVSCLSRRVALCLATTNAARVEVSSLADGNEGVRELAEAGVSVRGFHGNKTRLATWALASVLDDFRDSVVVVMHAHLAPLSLPFRARGARTFHVLLGIEVWKPLTFLQAKAFRRAERLLCISADSARRFAAANPAFDRVRVCHPGLPSPPHDGETVDEGFALVVGRMASSERYKGHDVLLDTWPSILDRAPGARLVIVGGGDDRTRLVEKSTALGLEASVRFLGEVSDDELERLYRRCAFFVMPSAGEGFGLVFLEAMRMSKACIGGIGAASEIIDHERTGFVVDPNDPSSIKSAIIELFRNPKRRARMGEEGRTRFETEFTSERFNERFRASLAQ